MCNRARFKGEAGDILHAFQAEWLVQQPRDNRFHPQELYPRSRAYVLRRAQGVGLGLDVMGWDVLGGSAGYPMTNVRNLALPQWRKLAERPDHRCLIPLTEFCEWTPDKQQVGDGPPLKGEMWFAVDDQPIFTVAGFWQEIAGTRHFAMVTCDANELVRPIHPKAMITILTPDDQERWLTGGYDDVVALQRPYPANHMTVRGPVFPTRKQGS